MWAIYTKILAVSTIILIFCQNNVVFQQNRWFILHFSPNLLLLALILHVMPVRACPAKAWASIHRSRSKWILLSQE
jgi:hypothetical protein